MKITQLLLCAIFGLFLASCSSISNNHNRDYLKSQATKPLSMPKGVSSSKVSSYYPVTGQYSAVTEPPSLIPPGAVKS